MLRRCSSQRAVPATIHRSAVALLGIAVLGMIVASASARKPGVADPTVAAGGAESSWMELEPGLEWGRFEAPEPSPSGDSMIRVLRIDPDRFALRLLNASAGREGKPLTPGQWCRSQNLLAAINASMFQADRLTSVSQMRTRSHVNNPRLSRDNSVLVFDARSPEISPVRLLDRQCDDLDSLTVHYGTVVQSIRMLSCTGLNVWAPQPRRSSTAAIGVDSAGRLLFIHVRSPFPTHDVVRHLLALPLDLARCMYAEGGPQAQLAVQSPRLALELTGTFEAGPFGETEVAPLPVPNVVGVVRR